MTKSLTNSYPFYRKNGGKLYKTKHREIINHYIDYISRQLLEGKEVDLPKLGTFRITGTNWRPPKDRWGPPNTNWKATMKLWEEYPELKAKQFVVYLNEHSNGYWYSLKWDKAKRLRHVTAYKMRPTELFKDKLSKEIFNGREYINQKVKKRR